MKGMDATHYAPNTAVTREQLVTILARYAAFKGADVSAEADPDFPDVGQVRPLRHVSHGVGGRTRAHLWH
ncbi:MAG: hypothetical protein ACLSHU_11315 [Oscillospiraceae bacterium]